MVKNKAYEIAAVLIAFILLTGCQPKAEPPSPPLDASQISGQRAFEEVQKLVSFTPRNSGAEGVKQAAEHLLARISPHADSAEIVVFEDETPKGKLEFRNVIGLIKGQSDKLIILASHYDTKAGISDNFQGANDSGSSSGLLVELIRVLKAQSPLPYTVLFAFFDGEECISEYGDHDGLHGSRNLVRKLKDQELIDLTKAMILLDMVGDRDLSITIPRNSTRELMAVVFDAARDAGVRHNFSLFKSAILDDHVPFLNAGIPSINIIDFEFGSQPGLNDYWHTEQDNLEHISAQSLQTIGQVVIHLLNRLAQQ
jgi:glutaminyl-peptide cyclotransferase